jgi:hypothetical protein
MFLLSQPHLTCLTPKQRGSPKDLSVKGLVPILARVGGGGKAFWSLGGGWDPDLSSSLLLPSQEVNGFTPPRALTTMCCLASGPKHWGQSVMDRTLQNCEPKETFSLISSFILGACYSTRKVTNTREKCMTTNGTREHGGRKSTWVQIPALLLSYHRPWVQDITWSTLSVLIVLCAVLDLSASFLRSQDNWRWLSHSGAWLFWNGLSKAKTNQ